MLSAANRSGINEKNMIELHACPPAIGHAKCIHDALNSLPHTSDDIISVFDRVFLGVWFKIA